MTTALISVSPAGEWVLAVLADAQEIKRKDIKIRLIPLIEVVYSKAKQYTPSMVDSIRLKIMVLVRKWVGNPFKSILLPS